MSAGQSILTENLPTLADTQAALDAIRFGRAPWPANLVALGRRGDFAVIASSHETTLIEMEPA